MATFLGLTAVTCLGAMLRKLATGEMILLGVPWLFNSFAFLVLSDKLDLPGTVNDWVGLGSVLVFGFWYFIILAVFEGMITWGRTLLLKRAREAAPSK